jgi:hypothetical protein
MNLIIKPLLLEMAELAKARQREPVNYAHRSDEDELVSDTRTPPAKKNKQACRQIGRVIISDYGLSSARARVYIVWGNEMMRRYRSKCHLGLVHSGAGEAPPDLGDDRPRNRMLKVADEMKACKTWSVGPGDQSSAQLQFELDYWVQLSRIPPEDLYHFLHSDDATCGGCGILAQYCACGITIVDACRQDLEDLLY